MSEDGPSGANWTGRAVEMAAVFMIGDGLLGLLQPRRHVELWEEDAMGTEVLVAPFRDRPGRRRVYGALQVAAGLMLAASVKKGDQRRR